MKLKLQRLAFQICFILFSIILPIVVIGNKFELYTKWKQTHPLIQVSLVGMVLIVLGLIAFKKRVSKWIAEMEPCLARYILEALSGVWVYALLVVITQSLQNNIDAVAFCASWTLGFNLVAFIVFEPLVIKTNYLVQRQIRQKELDEVIKRNKENEDI